MDGPLSPDLYRPDRPEPSWWEASAPPPRPRPALTGDRTVEVAILGGGYAGLSAGLRLAERGVEVAVLDAGEIGWGSSGRAGGIVGYGGSKRSEAGLVRAYGAAEVARAHAAQTDGLHWVRAFAEGAGLGEQVQGRGELLVAHSARSARALAADAKAHGDGVEPLPPSGREDVARWGGVRVTPGFGVHPLRLVRALADAAEDAGAAVMPRSEVLAWEEGGAGANWRHRLVTAGGSVTAARVIVAGNGFMPERLHGAFRARAVPVISNIGVTRVLTTEERARHPWLGDDPACDTRNLLAYFRMLPEGRLLFGMRGDPMGSEAGALRMKAALRARLDAALPGFRDAEIEYFWRGPVCATARLTPAIGRVPGSPEIGFAFGWHGSGVMMGTLGGRMAADLMLDGDETAIPAPWRGMPARIPVARLRPAYVAAAMGAYRVADWLS